MGRVMLDNPIIWRTRRIILELRVLGSLVLEIVIHLGQCLDTMGEIRVSSNWTRNKSFWIHKKWNKYVLHRLSCFKNFKDRIKLRKTAFKVNYQTRINILRVKLLLTGKAIIIYQLRLLPQPWWHKERKRQPHPMRVWANMVWVPTGTRVTINRIIRCPLINKWVKYSIVVACKFCQLFHTSSQY